MNFLNIFAVVALILALTTGHIEAKGKKGSNKGDYIKAGSHVAGRAVQGLGAAVVDKIGG
ncbi:cecropin-A1-like [Musca autumnalis]|uniref:cecropin-A1-like n=1 Tax=Musca autumnalis TaxID=221902 RepID=UPI003CE6C0E5